MGEQICRIRALRLIHIWRPRVTVRTPSNLTPNFSPSILRNVPMLLFFSLSDLFQISITLQSHNSFFSSLRKDAHWGEILLIGEARAYRKTLAKLISDPLSSRKFLAFAPPSCLSACCGCNVTISVKCAGSAHPVVGVGPEITASPQKNSPKTFRNNSKHNSLSKKEKNRVSCTLRFFTMHITDETLLF